MMPVFRHRRACCPRPTLLRLFRNHAPRRLTSQLPKEPSGLCHRPLGRFRILGSAEPLQTMTCRLTIVQTKKDLGELEVGILVAQSDGAFKPPCGLQPLLFISIQCAQVVGCRSKALFVCSPIPVLCSFDVDANANAVTAEVPYRQLGTRISLFGRFQEESKTAFRRPSSYSVLALANKPIPSASAWEGCSEAW